MSKNKVNYIPRIIFVGDSGVGKTSIINYAKTGKYEANSVPTIGAGTTTMSYRSNGKLIEYQLWDTAGQEIYRNIVPIYFRGAVGAIITFSMTDPTSFQNIQEWIDSLVAHADPDVKYLLVGNKIDVHELKVSEEDVKNWAESRILKCSLLLQLRGNPLIY
ncbi:small GTP-binding protein, putative [Trichomonas vaginalis G3]|uniref:Small GTP-binding protein, putative n=1 Tax=Trichomonas vaginalis (strain ATCC PRA-98 / G3) TaxID=412133 RepID=A2FBG0_TRIV3|nr:GTPase protein [Trichomonas vaginalis G3]EAX97747.1 small GTP-binding protein, putative [Trichomonas vaginalis G3]KAI5491178.1 GTPase protein [Trichomonas vaginalis G3]|eukprot:XP_001310677.1 small GTP-binding protein [Trichomonas vaginalis G3]